MNVLYFFCLILLVNIYSSFSASVRPFLKWNDMETCSANGFPSPIINLEPLNLPAKGLSTVVLSDDFINCNGHSFLCVAENNHGKIVKTVQPTDQSDCKPTPIIEMWTKTYLGFIGEDVTLFCKSSFDVSWYSDTAAPYIINNGNLYISNLTWDHMGTYTCIASNNFGSTRVESFLYPISL